MKNLLNSVHRFADTRDVACGIILGLSIGLGLIGAILFGIAGLAVLAIACGLIAVSAMGLSLHLTARERHLQARGRAEWIATMDYGTY